MKIKDFKCLIKQRHTPKTKLLQETKNKRIGKSVSGKNKEMLVILIYDMVE